MSVLLPEKTVEIWTAIVLVQKFPTVDIWSPVQSGGSVDQWIRAGKTWAFELKTADPGGIEIDLAQLQGHAFDPPHKVPVLYLLPKIPWVGQPTEPFPAETTYRQTFNDWAWVISAVQLAARFGILALTPPARGRPSIPLATLPFRHPTHSGWTDGMTLKQFLDHIEECDEPRPWTFRSERDHPAGDRDHPSLSEGHEDHYFLAHVPLSALRGPLNP